MNMTIIYGILICLGFMGVIITLMRIVLKAKKLRREQQRYYEEKERR